MDTGWFSKSSARDLWLRPFVKFDPSLRSAPSATQPGFVSALCSWRTHDMDEQLQLVLSAHPREEGRVADHLDEDTAHAPQVDGVPGGCTPSPLVLLRVQQRNLVDY